LRSCFELLKRVRSDAREDGLFSLAKSIKVRCRQFVHGPNAVGKNVTLASAKFWNPG